MKKQERKELERSLFQLIDAHLAQHHAKTNDKVQKVIRAASKDIAKKFSKVLKRSVPAKANKISKPSRKADKK
jgi:dsDNA-specific endonuclease/ATPase MutS2